MQYTTEQLAEILERHKKWLRDEDGGSRADLSDADLSDADLSRANLSDADLSRADLSRANLSHADLRCADLSDAANLNLQIEDGLIQKIAIAVNADKKALEMGRWHTCDTTHCIAGWAVTLAKNGKELEEKYGTQIAGLMLLGVDAHSHFFDSNEDGKAYLNQFLPEESSMTLEELNTAIFDINKQYERDILKVKAAYAKSQELYKIGDIVTNGICTVWIKKIGWDLDYKGIPSPIYKGDNLTKKGTVNKVNPCASIYGNEGTKLINIKEIAV